MLKAGKTIRNIFKESLSWVKNPLQAYLRKLINRLELNFSFDDALDTFADSCGGNEARLLVSALKINNRIFLPSPGRIFEPGKENNNQKIWIQ